jgi:hypothetical protein
VRNVLADDWAEMLGVEVQQVNGRGVGELQPNAYYNINERGSVGFSATVVGCYATCMAVETLPAKEHEIALRPRFGVPFRHL